AEVANPHESFGENVEKEAPLKLESGQGHYLLLATMGVILPSEGDSLSIEGDQAMIGNGNTMGIAAQVAQHVHGAAEGWSGVDHPVFIYRENGSGSRTVWSRRVPNWVLHIATYGADRDV